MFNHLRLPRPSDFDRLTANRWNVNELVLSLGPNIKTIFVFLTLVAIGVSISAYLVYIWVPLANGIARLVNAECSSQVVASVIGEIIDFVNYFQDDLWLSKANVLSFFSSCNKPKVRNARYNFMGLEVLFNTYKSLCYPKLNVNWEIGLSQEEKCAHLNSILVCLPKELESASQVYTFNPKTFLDPVCSTFLVIREQADKKDSFWKDVNSAHCKALITNEGLCPN